jgi:hypothetical protein
MKDGNASSLALFNVQLKHLSGETEENQDNALFTIA